MLYIEETKVTPEIKFDIKKQEFILKGCSRPEDCDSFYKDVFDWIDTNIFEISSSKKLDVILDLEYFNSSSAKEILRLISTIDKIRNKIVNFIWKFEVEDEELLEAGKEFSQIIKTDFTFVSK